MAEKLWSPKNISETQIYKFIQRINEVFSQNINTYDELHKWSVNNLNHFWREAWHFCKIDGTLQESDIFEKGHDFKSSTFFEKSSLNFCKNILGENDDSLAIIEMNEDGAYEKHTFKDLHEKVSIMQKYFVKMGLKKGDRVAGFLPNTHHAIVSMLAASSIGAIWTACSPDFGFQGVFERFSQVEPKIIIVCNGYKYNGKIVDCREKSKKLIDSMEKTSSFICVDYVDIESVESTESWDEIIEKDNGGIIDFQEFPFNHPLYILYSSGTTGAPKAIVHGAGGTLIQHKKEHIFQSDINPHERVFYFTTVSWMMWHWLISVLANRSTIVLYEGSPSFPKSDSLLKYMENINVNFFGTSAKYIDSLCRSGEDFSKKYNLEHLKTIGSTGSPLSEKNFKYVYEKIKSDVHLSSLSGGTDIISCFAIGNPISPVYSGQLQGAGLGMDIDNFIDGEGDGDNKGELICKSPFPSKPIYFFNDNNDEKFNKSYFQEDKNIWHHGDFVEKTKENGWIFHGRSDATLNPGGVRIGTAEIYAAISDISEIIDCVAVSKCVDGDDHIAFFVVMKNDQDLSTEMMSLIKSTIRKNASPRHVPKFIKKVTSIPKTRNGKISEMAVMKTVNGKKINNLTALANPECLKEFFFDIN